MNGNARLFLLLGATVIVMCIVSRSYMQFKRMESRMAVFESLKGRSINHVNERSTIFSTKRKQNRVDLTTSGKRRSKIRPGKSTKSKIYSPAIDFNKFKPDIRDRSIHALNKCQEMVKRKLVPKQIPTITLQRILVSDKYKFMICVIPKVSSTSWRRTMLRLSGKFSDEKILQLPNHAIFHKMLSQYTTLKKFNKTEREFRLSNYTKVMFVRNPFERLLSAYRSKFVNGKEFHKLYGIKIIKKFRPNATQMEKKTGHNVTFLEFIKFFLWQKDWAANPHWTPYWNLCDPCGVKYNYIGLFEKLIPESNDFLRHIGADKYTFPARDKYYKANKTDDVLKHYYSQIPKSYIPGIMKKFRNDLELFAFLNWTVPETG